MSSPTDSPYKSRLLNFLNRQYIKLSSSLGKSGRQLRLAADWGLQILIYPIYLVAQTGRFIERQIEKRVEQFNLLGEETEIQINEEINSSDQPIRQILQSVEPLIAPLESSSANNSLVTRESSLTVPRLIRGLAVSLESRKLELINRENQVVDILSPQQEEKLQKRLSWEIANHSRKVRVAKALKNPTLPKIQTDNPNVIPPVRTFWQVMEWMQTNQVATAINLFGEAKIKPLESKSIVLIPRESSLELTPIEALIPLDNTVAKWEKKTGQLVTRNETLRGMLNKNQAKTIEKENYQASEPFQIEALIKAAIDYFFGPKGNSKLFNKDKTPSQNQLPKTANTKLPPPVEDDPWLSWGDLYVIDTPTPEKTVHQPKTVSLSGNTKQNKHLPPGRNLPPNPSNKTQAKFKSEPTPQLVTTKVKTKQILQTPDIKDIVPTSDLTEISASEYSYVHPSQDWIDAEAKPVGYIKHPLQRLLEWLDKIIVFIEDSIVAFIQWIQRKFF